MLVIIVVVVVFMLLQSNAAAVNDLAIVEEIDLHIHLGVKSNVCLAFCVVFKVFINSAEEIIVFVKHNHEKNNRLLDFTGGTFIVELAEGWLHSRKVEDAA